MNKKQENFRRLTESRTNRVLEALAILGNCSNRLTYDYSKQEVDRIFAEIESAMKDTKKKFDTKPQIKRFRWDDNITESIMATLHESPQSVVETIDIDKDRNIFFFCRRESEGVLAIGKKESQGKQFTVCEESTATVKLPSSPSTRGLRERKEKLASQLLNSGHLVRQNGVYVFVKDVTFSTPSAASSFILGQSSNGFTDWKTDDEHTLKDIFG